MNRAFDLYRRIGHRFVAGWLESEVLTILAVLDSAQRSRNISAAVAEIGVHHGRLFIGLRLLQRETEYSLAIDVFENQGLNVDSSGQGDLAIFRKNVKRWSSLDRVVVHRGDSTALLPGDLREQAFADIRFFSVDGGHTDSTVFSDMMLAEATICQGGIVIADDIFNEQWPEVSTGTLRYLGQGGLMVPFAIGFNKVFFSASEYTGLYQDILLEHFGGHYLTSVKTATFAEHHVLVISRVPRRLRRLVGRNKIAKRAYRSYKNLRRG